MALTRERKAQLDAENRAIIVELKTSL